MWTEAARVGGAGEIMMANAHFVVAALALCSIAGTDAPSSEVPRIMLQLPSWDELMIQIGAASKKNDFLVQKMWTSMNSTVVSVVILVCVLSSVGIMMLGCDVQTTDCVAVVHRIHESHTAPARSHFLDQNVLKTIFHFAQRLRRKSKGSSQASTCASISTSMVESRKRLPHRS